MFGTVLPPVSDAFDAFDADVAVPPGFAHGAVIEAPVPDGGTGVLDSQGAFVG